MKDIEMDSPMAGATSVVKRRSLSPPLFTTKRAKLDQDELTSLNAKLNDPDSTNYWSQQLQKASKDPRKMNILLLTILSHLIDALAETSAKDDFIPPSGVSQFVDGFNPNERREWEEGIRTCMQRRDWADLIPHRTPTVTLQDVIFDHGHSETSEAGSNSRHRSRLVRDYVRLSASLRGSIQLFSNDGPSGPCDCIACLGGNTKEIFTSSLYGR